MNKCFTYKGFDTMEDAFEYAKKAEEAGATYIEIMVKPVRLKYDNHNVIVQHNAKRWIK